MTAATAQREGAATGRALHARGINVDLAPVADVNHGSFLGSRSFGSDPGAVASAACAFAGGVESAGVNATLKHFPGLGRTSQNTDLRRVRVTASAAALRADLEPYRRCAATTRLVMVSNATYPAFDPRRPAVFSRRIVTDLLRGELGFGGVTITDTLAAPGVASPAAAVRATRAGVDLLLYVDERSSARGYRAVLRALRAGQLSGAQVSASAARIDALAR
jgi:beta-N-acetylhexosaminidase